MATNINFTDIVCAWPDSKIMYTKSSEELIDLAIDEKLKPIYDRLSILENPTPEKLEKYAALKKAYEHYKMVEKLLNDD